jgi:hypothetical protein
MAEVPHTPEGWSISLTSDQVSYVRARIYTTQAVDEFIDALRTIKPLVPASAKYEIDGDWAE